MRRTVQALALVLKMNPVGENHRGLSMLVAQEGLIRPLAFGAQSRRSRLRATAVPFNIGLADLQFNAVNNQWRLENFEPKNCHDALGENLDRYYTASAWAEILLSTHGGGEDSAALLNLTSGALSLLCKAEGEAITRLKTGFLWNFLDIEGVRPDVSQCGQCERTLSDSAGNVHFGRDGLLLCPVCRIGPAEEKRVLSSKARSWLQQISSGLDKAVRFELELEDLAMVESWMNILMKGLVGRPLRTFS